MSYQHQEFKVFNIQECYFGNKNTLWRVDKNWFYYLISVKTTTIIMLDQQEYSSPYNIECVSVVYNNELKEHLDELDQLRDTFIEDEKTYRSNRR